MRSGREDGGRDECCYWGPVNRMAPHRQQDGGGGGGEGGDDDDEVGRSPGPPRYSHQWPRTKGGHPRSTEDLLARTNQFSGANISESLAALGQKIYHKNGSGVGF